MTTELGGSMGNETTYCGETVALAAAWALSTPVRHEMTALAQVSARSSNGPRGVPYRRHQQAPDPSDHVPGLPYQRSALQDGYYVSHCGDLPTFTRALGTSYDPGVIRLHLPRCDKIPPPLNVVGHLNINFVSFRSQTCKDKTPTHIPDPTPIVYTLRPSRSAPQSAS